MLESKMKAANITSKGLRWIHFKCYIRGGLENNEEKKQELQKRDKLLEIMCTSQNCAARNC